MAKTKEPGESLESKILKELESGPKLLSEIAEKYRQYSQTSVATLMSKLKARGLVRTERTDEDQRKLRYFRRHEKEEFKPMVASSRADAAGRVIQKTGAVGPSEVQPMAPNATIRAQQAAPQLDTYRPAHPVAQDASIMMWKNGEKYRLQSGAVVLVTEQGCFDLKSGVMVDVTDQDARGAHMIHNLRGEIMAAVEL